MSVKIRMQRMGANRDISFRVVALDSRRPRDGRFLELLGWYDPKKTGTNYQLNVERIEHWKSKGAQISDTVMSLLKKARKSATPAGS
jgi:small subunit ribosomal protein S16